MRQSLEMKGMEFMLSSHNLIVIYVFSSKKKKIIVTNAFIKKKQKLPQSEKEQALKAYQSYEKRVKEGGYYEKES